MNANQYDWLLYLINNLKKRVCDIETNSKTLFPDKIPTLTELEELLDSDYLIINREGINYKVAMITMKSYFGTSDDTNDDTSAIVGVGKVGSMIIE